MVNVSMVCSYCNKELQEKEKIICYYCKKIVCKEHRFGLQHKCPKIVEAEKFRTEKRKMDTVTILFYAIAAVGGLVGIQTLEQNLLFSIVSFSIAVAFVVPALYLRWKWKTKFRFFGQEL